MEFDLNIVHEDYSSFAEIRTQSRDFYDGDLGVMTRYLDQGIYELDPYHAQRKQKVVYENLMRPIVHARAGLLTRKRPKTRLPDELRVFMDNVDGYYTRSHAFLKRLILNADIDGVSWCKIDMPNQSASERGPYLSRQQERENGIRPFMELVPASAVINWSVNPVDYRLDWLVYKVSVCAGRVPGLPVTLSDRWIIWYRDHYEVYEEGTKGKGFTPIETGPNTLGEIPFVPFYGIKAKEFAGYPFGYQILSHLRRIMNLESQIDHALELMNLSRMYIFAGERPMEVPTADNAFYLPFGQNGEKPEIGFAEPSGRGIELSHVRISDLISRVYRNTLHISRKPTSQAQSGEAQREETTILRADLSAAATNHEGSWKRVWEFMYRWETGSSIDTVDLSVEFQRDYDVRRSQPPEILSLIALYDSGLLSQESVWEALIEGEILPETFDAEEEKKRIGTKELNPTPGVARFSTPEKGISTNLEDSGTLISNKRLSGLSTTS